MALQADALGFSYAKGNPAGTVLRNVNLLLDDGSFTAIMGPSGSGKSTLLYCLSGILSPTEGSVRLDGQDIAASAPGALEELRRTEFGFVFQRYNLVDSLNLWQNVALPSLFGGVRISKVQALEALNRVGLSDFAGRYPEEVSGGQRQRVAIARALAAQRRIVFADEPTGALDSASGRLVMNQLKEVSASGASVVLVTHDPFVASFAQRVVFLYDGAVVDEISAPDAHQISARLASLESL